MIISDNCSATISRTITPVISNHYHHNYHHHYQAKLMSPPTTPKQDNSNHHEPFKVNDFMVLLPQPTHANVCHTDDDDDQHDSSQYTNGGPLRLSRKLSLSQSIHAMTLANHDTLDTFGRRFSLPFKNEQQQQHQSSSSQCQSPRTKSLPRRSPTSSRGVFTMNVFDRPRKEPTKKVGLTKKWHCRRSSAISDKSSASRLSASTSSPSSLSVPSPSSLPLCPTGSLPSASLALPPSPSLPSTSTLYIDSNNKPRVDTFFYDKVDLSVKDHDVYSPSWMPLWESLDRKPNIRVVWKGSPLYIHTLPYYNNLHPNEQNIASTLRLTPEQYLKCKRAMILSAQVFHQHGLPFRKSDAQKVCRIDVNKTSSLWGVFNRLGWLHPRLI